jgi:hypothetical protein
VLPARISPKRTEKNRRKKRNQKRRHQRKVLYFVGATLTMALWHYQEVPSSAVAVERKTLYLLLPIAKVPRRTISTEVALHAIEKLVLNLPHQATKKRPIEVSALHWIPTRSIPCLALLLPTKNNEAEKAVLQT